MARPPLSENCTLQNAARDGGYAVPAMCCYNIEAVVATVRAAEAAKSPAIVQLFPWAMLYAGRAFVLAVAEMCHSASVPCSIATKAEPGRIEGGEDGVAETADLEGVLTTPEQAELQGKPITTVIEAGTAAMQTASEQYMKWLGSAGKASNS
ncbi:hypothetical protein F4779DRAFT_615240 [Xylariaceae sp. FL0662B]|nr:hypothetical protein F4779DRAFT_615240 [Xylariaceae sp. FL0662B]